MPVSDAAVDLFDIQQRLRADTDGSARREIEAELSALQQALKHRLDAGVAPDEFKKLTAVGEAAAAAREVVAMTWNVYHKG
jgi:hypothetical protein